MNEKIIQLYNECVYELKTIGIDILDEKKYGKIEILISKRSNKRYGCCKQEDPDKRYKTIIKYKRRKIIRYEKFNKHFIEISSWVLNLDDNIIKNTIMHEIIHCIPYCNNHGTEFKKYAELINNLGYNITRLGNKKDDFNKSNLEYKEETSFKYKIICKKCNQIIYRQRLVRNFVKKYRCIKCGGKFDVFVNN